MIDPRIVAERSSRIFTLVFLLCVALLGFALYLQFADDLLPCPWCIVQRVAFIAVGLIALAGALIRPGPGGTIFVSVLGVAASLGGAVAAGYHIYLQSDAKRATACVGSPVERILDASQIGQWIPPLLQYDGPCTLKPWSFLALSIPEWSFVWFVILVVTFVATPYLSSR